MTPPLNCSPRFTRWVRQIATGRDNPRFSAFHRQVRRPKAGGARPARGGFRGDIGRWLVAGPGVLPAGLVAAVTPVAGDVR